MSKVITHPENLIVGEAYLVSIVQGTKWLGKFRAISIKNTKLGLTFQSSSNPDDICHWPLNLIERVEEV